MRLRLYDFRVSRGPALVGLCSSDVSRIADLVNTLQRRLVFAREAGDEGWWGSWAEMAFTVRQSSPYLTLPRGVARLEKAQVCNHTIPIQNQFYEYLQFGNGRLPRTICPPSFLVGGYSRNNVVTYTDLTNPPQFIRVYATDLQDHLNGRVFISGLDQNHSPVITNDGSVRVSGEFIQIQYPFAQSLYQYSSITGIQKDVTKAQVQIFQSDPSTTSEVLLSIMDPGELVADYRRYYFSNLCGGCCQPSAPDQPLTVTAICKLDLLPVAVDTDWLLIQNLEALIEEAQSVRLSEADETKAKQMAAEKHVQAIRLLQGELVHYLGKEKPAMSFYPFGSARLERQKIGILM